MVIIRYIKFSFYLKTFFVLPSCFMKNFCFRNKIKLLPKFKLFYKYLLHNKEKKKQYQNPQCYKKIFSKGIQRTTYYFNFRVLFNLYFITFGNPFFEIILWILFPNNCFIKCGNCLYEMNSLPLLSKPLQLLIQHLH